MTFDHNSLSFGQYLKAVRLKKGIELELVSKETRVGMDNLRHIENEAHKQLPAVAFVKGFLRAYAQAIGVDGDDVVRRYEESLLAERMSARAEADFNKLNQRFWPRLLLALGMLVGLMALVITLVVISERPMANKQALQTEVEPQAPAHAASASAFQSSGTVDVSSGEERIISTALPPVEPTKDTHGMDGLTPPLDITQDVAAKTASTEPLPGNLKLEIFAREETWMKITIDGGEGKEFLLKPGGRLELSATSRFGLFIGNAGGVAMLLNDEPLPPLGRSGQVVMLQLP